MSGLTNAKSKGILEGSIVLDVGDEPSITSNFSTPPSFTQNRSIIGYEGANTFNFSAVDVPVENCVVVISIWGATSTNASGGALEIRENDSTLASRSFPFTNSNRVQVADLYLTIENPTVGSHTYQLYGVGQLNTTRITNCGGKVFVIEPNDTHKATGQEQSVLPS